MTLLTTASLSSSDLLRVASSLGLTAKELDRAAPRAVNTVARRTRGNARREIRAYLTLSARSVNERVELVKRASRADPTAKVALDRRSRGGGTGGNARPTLMSFGGKPNKPQSEGRRTKRGRLTKAARAPFTYQIVKGGPRRRLPGGFVQRPTRRFNLNEGGFDSVSGQRAQAFIRTGPGRYPLAVPRGPSIAAVWQSRQNDISETVLTDTRERLGTEMSRQANLVLDRAFPRSRAALAALN